MVATGPGHHAGAGRILGEIDQVRAFARLVVCGRAGRGRDVQDPAQLAAAADDARTVLDALGLLDGRDTRPSPGHVKDIGAKVVHGTRSAVQAHLDAGQYLCEPCRRWAQVQERRGGPPAPAPRGVRVREAVWRHPDAPEPAADGHGTWRAYRAHRASGEGLCGPCAAYLEWWRGRRRKNGWGAR